MNKSLLNKTYKCIGEDSAPRVDTVFAEAAELLRTNPAFRSSLNVAILKAAVAKYKHGRNAVVEERIVNFYCFIMTFDKKAADVLYAILDGLGERWLRRLDARERLLCILDGGGQGCIIVQRMRAAIRRRTPSGGTPPAFALAIDATKVPQLAEVSQGYQAIIGLEYPDHILDIVGKSKEEVKLILNGK